MRNDPSIAGNWRCESLLDRLDTGDPVTLEAAVRLAWDGVGNSPPTEEEPNSLIQLTRNALLI